MQSAFVDIGLERDAFLYVSDFFEDNEEYDKIVSGVEEKVARLEQEAARARAPEAAVPAPPAPETHPGAAAGEAEAAAEPQGAPEERERGHRRRSRRRRFRDRGFPESKYASRNEVAPAAAGAREAPRRFGEPQEEEPIILPGESLAKYRRRQPQVEETEAAAEPREEVAEERETGGRVADALLETPVNEESERIAAAQAMAEAQAEAERTPHREQTKSDAEPPSLSREAPSEPADDCDPPAEEAGEDPVARDENHPEASGPAAPTHLSEEASAEGQPAVADRLGNQVLEDPAADAPAPPPAPEAEASEASGRARSGGSFPEAEKPPASEASGQAESAGASSELREAPEAAPAPAEPRAELSPAPQGGPASARAAAGQASVRGPEQPARFQRPSRRMRRKLREQQHGGQLKAPERAERPERHERPERPEKPERAERPERERGAEPLISDLLREGQEIIVQIAKEPLGKKGARITSHVALPGRYVVYMPTVDHVGVSRKIGSDEERMRLKRIMQEARRDIPGGFIVRTAAEGRSEEDLKHDIEFLHKAWADIRAKAERRSAPALLHHDINLVERILRDQLSGDYASIWVDSEHEYEKVLEFAQRFQPALVTRVKLYTRDTPIFEEFGIQEEINKALKPKVWLKSGGYIVINQTEALVAIDVNTGKYVGKTQRLEDTIVKTNVDAIKEIVRQIRLRDLGGIIVVDFIDMDERKNRVRVMQALEDALRSDRAPSKILQFNDFGLVAITRKRVKQSLERALCTPCAQCGGSGFLKSPHTVAMEILAEAARLVSEHRGRKEITLRVNPEVAHYLKQHDVGVVQEIEDMIRRPLLIKADPSLQAESFDFN
jgi:ribonuclease G